MVRINNFNLTLTFLLFDCSNATSPAAHLQMLQMAGAVASSSGVRFPSPATSSSSPSSQNHPTAAAVSQDGSNDGEATAENVGQSAGGEEGKTRENMERALMHLYGMGQGINSFQGGGGGVAQSNPFLHPTMFSATGM